MIASSEIRLDRFLLPAVVGSDMRAARLVLERAGLGDIQIHYVESYEADFTVISQRPEPGSLVDAQARVVLDVARQSLVDYLPQIYQQPDGETTSFLRDFLFIVQSLQDRVAMRLDSVHEIFDPRTTEPDFLPWLASWLAITLSPEWDELERRKMLRAATELFPYRGTARAIESFVRIYTGADVEVLENEWPFAGFRVGVGSTVGSDTVILPPMNLAHCFVVRVARSADAVTDEEIIKIHQIIGAQKPAHTTYFLAFGDAVGAGPMDVFMEVGGGIGIGVTSGSNDGVDGESSEVEPEETTARGAQPPTRSASKEARRGSSSQRSTSSKASKAAPAPKAAKAPKVAEKKKASPKRAASKKAVAEKAAGKKSTTKQSRSKASTKRADTRGKSKE